MWLRFKLSTTSCSLPDVSLNHSQGSSRGVMVTTAPLFRITALKSVAAEVKDKTTTKQKKDSPHTSCHWVINNHYFFLRFMVIVQNMAILSLFLLTWRYPLIKCERLKLLWNPHYKLTLAFKFILQAFTHRGVFSMRLIRMSIYIFKLAFCREQEYYVFLGKKVDSADRSQQKKRH